MNENIVEEATYKMVRTLAIANMLSITCLGMFLAAVMFIPLYQGIGMKDGIILTLIVAVAEMNAVHFLGYWKQKSIFNVSIALLRYIETNHPEIEMPPIPDGIKKH